MTKLFAIVNQKGGVGKTTTSINLATAIAAIGKKALIIDLDPQGNASTGLGFSNKESLQGTYELLTTGVTLSSVIKETSIPGLSIIPSNQHLSGAEIELAGMKPGSREILLKDKLSSHAAGFDYVLVDCPPSLGLLTLNALVAVQKVLVPLQCEFYALEGLSQLLKTIKLVKANINPNLSMQGVVLTMFDTRSLLSSQVAADVRSCLGEKVYETHIPRNVRIAEAPSFGKPAILYDMNCLGSKAYINLAKEVLSREGDVA